MRLISRNDASLAVALITATVVVFQRPLRFALDFAQEIQQRYYVDLVPALTILIGVFIFHLSRKRQQAKADAREAAAQAAQARLRTAELERLMAFGQALANAFDPQALQQILWRHVPTFAQDHECWLLIRKESRWEPLLQERAANSDSIESLEHVADRVIAVDKTTDARAEGIVVDGTLCFPLTAGGASVGVFGIHRGASLSPAERKALGAATAVIAIAVRNVQLLATMRDESMRDALTGCVTRKHALESLERSMRLSRRSALPLSIVMFDVDHFKRINDELGHLRGDALLREVGEHLTRVLRSTDIRCRYGGDEFLIVCPDTPLLGAQQVAECLRREIATMTVEIRGVKQQVTASFGVAAIVPGELDMNALIERADAALYMAKGGGRNRFCVQTTTSTAAAPAAMDPAAPNRSLSAVS